MSVLIKRLTLIGVGLIGASLAQALRKRDLVGEIVGVDRRRASLDYALEQGIIDRVETHAARGVEGATLVLIATPVSTIVSMVEDCVAGLGRGVVVTDVGSVKGRIVERCEALMPEGCAFVGGHPIAGREHSGVEAALASLFDGARTILTPSSVTPRWALELVTEMWESVGATVESMEPHWHDQVLAATSHLPHLMAYNVVNTLSDLEDHLRTEVFRYAASGFRDFTRIASSDPTMWRDICLENKDAILSILGRFKSDLEKLTKRVEEEDADGLYGIFARSKDTRARILQENKILRGE
ncbi:prephenate dehydrogenase [Magnetococcus marinus MC-1]|uniref:prephenate dehydrogenase n=1 Tax=Magnetococcus marinus (strain ATCC BAA-1437 / JCM 17883 / MC-1) TaxID=156889 RepID=A0L409_MAGMM|nr:prephenate dehydrogenase/arogenate dehydrogenase family protein [Magnetococcus marinus]ABK42702.1 prephenate dehydrogenase [Magnetococcus marinus MC-1]